MNTKDQLRAELHDLLAYFPGRGRASLAWLVVMPILAIVLFACVFGRVARIPSDGIPYPVFTAAGQSALWIYLPAAFVCLIRVNHSQRSSLSETGRIIFSSLLYGFLIGVPAVLVAGAWALFHVGLSVASILHGLIGIVAVCASVSLIVGILGLAAHYLGFFVPLLLLLMKTYVYLVPIAYSMNVVPETWRTVQTLIVPLAPAITIMRNAIVNSTASTSGSCWGGALLHSVAGVAVLIWLWKRITGPEVRPVSSEAAPGASPDEPST